MIPQRSGLRQSWFDDRRASGVEVIPGRGRAFPACQIGWYPASALRLLLVELQRAILQQDTVCAGAQIGSISAGTGAKVEAKAVSRADHVVSVELAVCEGHAFVRAGVLQREQAATALEYGQLQPIQFHHSALVFRKVCQERRPFRFCDERGRCSSVFARRRSRRLRGGSQLFAHGLEGSIAQQSFKHPIQAVARDVFHQLGRQVGPRSRGTAHVDVNCVHDTAISFDSLSYQSDIRQLWLPQPAGQPDQRTEMGFFPGSLGASAFATFKARFLVSISARLQ